MTIEEKAKRYDEAFGIARNVWRFSSNNAEIMRMEELFHELKESEDEKIRNQIIKFIEEYGNPIHCEWQKDWIAWLEKQVEQKSADKVEPKFNVGDWVVKGDTIAQILDIQEQYYVGLDINGKDFTSSRFLNDDKIHLWTIQDAKDGDVLYSPCNTLLWIFKTKDTIHCGCNLNYNNGSICGEGYIMTPTDAIPATKSQRDILFSKMKEEGYEWSEETLELKKISQRTISAEAKEALYDKPTDEEMKESPTPLPSCVDEAAEEWFHYVKYKSDLSCAPINAFKAGAEWMMNNLWHSADGGDLPEIDREVVVFTQEKGLSPKVCISHRPNPKGWDGTSISTGKTEHFQPMLYGKGGWSLPDVKWWLDCKMPYKEGGEE